MMRTTRLPTEKDALYEAHGYYHIFNTCNNWTGRVLRKSGAKTGLWTPFPKMVLFYLPPAAVEPDDVGLDLLEESVAVDPRDANARLYLVEVLLKRGDADGCIEALLLICLGLEKTRERALAQKDRDGQGSGIQVHASFLPRR